MTNFAAIEDTLVLISLFEDCMANSRLRKDVVFGSGMSQYLAHKFFTHDNSDDDEDVGLDSILSDPPRGMLDEDGFVLMADVGNDASSVPKYPNVMRAPLEQGHKKKEKATASGTALEKKSTKKGKAISSSTALEETPMMRFATTRPKRTHFNERSQNVHPFRSAPLAKAYAFQNISRKNPQFQ